MRIPYKIKFLKHYLFRKGDGEKILKNSYKKLFKKELNLVTPKSFSELIFNRMIMINRHGNDKFTKLADKYLVRDYVRDRVGEKYLVRLLWSGDSPDDIPFETLPDRCVIKTNHGSGGNFVYEEGACKDELLLNLRKKFKENYYWASREYHYYKIPRKILIEEFLDDGVPNGPLDYRIWCFNGKPELIQIDSRSHDINPFYDCDWNKLNLSYMTSFKDFDIERPANLHEMLEVASALSSEFDFVRVDLYNLNGKIYFGELTFTPLAGHCVFKPDSWDKYLGEKWVGAHPLRLSVNSPLRSLHNPDLMPNSNRLSS